MAVCGRGLVKDTEQGLIKDGGWQRRLSTKVIRDKFSTVKVAHKR
jgi:hypothetical protein